MEQANTEVGAPELGNLDDSDMFGLRLAAQVLGHKAALAGRPRVAQWFAQLESLIAFRLAGRGVGVVWGDEPELSLSPNAEPADRRLLVEYLRLLAGNEGLSDRQREACRALSAAYGE